LERFPENDSIEYDTSNCWYDEIKSSNLLQLINIAKLPRHFNQNYGYMEHQKFDAPKKVNTASILMTVSPEYYDKCKNYMESHYLIETNSDYSYSVTKTGEPTEFIPNHNIKYLQWRRSLYGHGGAHTQSSMSLIGQTE